MTAAVKAWCKGDRGDGVRVRDDHAMLMPPSVLHAAGQVALRVAVRAKDPVRAAAIAALVAATGHEVVSDHAADLVLSDHPVTSTLPTLVLSSSNEVSMASLLPADITAAQLAAALPAVAAGLTVRLSTVNHGLGSTRPTLTPREAEVLDCLGAGLSNKSVARQLGISQHTVKFHLEAVFAKLDATSRAEAVVKGLRTGLIDL